MSTGTNSERIQENNTSIGTNNSTIDSIKTAINNLPSTGNTTAVASDILSGKTAVSKGATITGTLGTESKTVKSTTTSQTVTPTTGKLINEVTVSPIVLEQVTVEPSVGTQTILPTSGKDGISQVNFTGVPLQYKEVEITQNTFETIQADQGYFGLEAVELNVHVSGGGGGSLEVFNTTLTQNGVMPTVYPQAGYDGFSEVNVTVDVPAPIVISRVKIYSTQQERDQALQNDFLCIGDIGAVYDSEQDEQIQQGSRYFGLKLELEYDIANYQQWSPSQSTIQGGEYFIPYNTYNWSILDMSASEFDYLDATMFTTPKVEVIIQNNSTNAQYKVEIQYKYVDDGQTEKLKLYSAQIIDSLTDEVLATADNYGYLFLPFKIEGGNDASIFNDCWCGSLVKGVSMQVMTNSLYYSGTNWSQDIMNY